MALVRVSEWRWIGWIQYGFYYTQGLRMAAQAPVTHCDFDVGDTDEPHTQWHIAIVLLQLNPTPKSQRNIEMRHSGTLLTLLAVLS